MATAAPDEALAPLRVGFDSEIELTIHSAFLPTARLLQCDPVAHVSVSTLHKTTTSRAVNNGGVAAGGRVTVTSVVANERPVGSTRRLYFTSRPNFNETLRFMVPYSGFHPSSWNTATSPAAVRKSWTAMDDCEDEQSVDQRILITVMESEKQVYGQATCPFLLYAPSSSTQPVRLMLQPRNMHDKRDSSFKADVATLAKHGMDDFGFVTISWKVSLVPHGGALIAASQPSVNQPTFPVGLVLRTTWLAPGHTYQRGTQYTTSVEFGGQDRFVFDGAKPLFLTIQKATQLQQAIVNCTIQNVVNHTNSHDVAVALPIQPMASFAMERDVWWTAAVRTARGVDLGLLITCIRLVQRPLDSSTPMCTDETCNLINNPVHQAQYAHVARDWNRPQPDVPPGAYQPIFWESDQHIQRATERRWKLDRIVEASPSLEHVRHILDVLMGRAVLDPGVGRVASVFFNQTSRNLSPEELREFLVTCAFHTKGMTVQEAARFSFFALRHDMEQAIARDSVVFMLEHSLLGKTVEMPVAEVRRYVVDIFGDTTYVIFDDFVRYFMHNYAMWYAFGVPITTGEKPPSPHDGGGGCSSGGSSSAAPPAVPHLNPTTVLRADEPADKVRKAAPAATSAKTATSVAAPNEGEVWRRFIARVQHSNKAFSVTAHVNDTIADVMSMVQNSTGIRAICQEWRANGALLDPKCTLGSTELGLDSQDGSVPEVTIIARDEVVRLVMMYREKGFRWELRMPASEKVLKLRALVQQKTMIPLSRCVLQVRGSCLVDRHPLMHYHLQDGDVVDIIHE